MNILNQKFPDSTQPKQPTESDLSISVQQADLLNRYMDLAQESELVQDIPSTNNYYLNRITYLPDHPSLWYEYGVYLLKYIIILLLLLLLLYYMIILFYFFFHILYDYIIFLNLFIEKEIQIELQNVLERLYTMIILIYYVLSIIVHY